MHLADDYSQIRSETTRPSAYRVVVVVQSSLESLLNANPSAIKMIDALKIADMITLSFEAIFQKDDSSTLFGVCEPESFIPSSLDD